VFQVVLLLIYLKMSQFVMDIQVWLLMFAMDMDFVLDQIFATALMDTMEMIVKIFCATQRMNQPAVLEMVLALGSIRVLVTLEKQEMNAN
jgi:hypothetical protein